MYGSGRVVGAARQGFEPWRLLHLAAFKAAALDHYAISPMGTILASMSGTSKPWAECQIVYAYIGVSRIVPGHNPTLDGWGWTECRGGGGGRSVGGWGWEVWKVDVQVFHTVSRGRRGRGCRPCRLHRPTPGIGGW